ncbi:TonB-dependent receptor plug domain-containing protein [Methylogaea oryzae]|uniref:TonB-dependent receptor n=1 Tax=Methylogaea oryzae TaxID=1295382 RepID=A0A8D4VQP6_9GAMM|nr:TonB-dependent receptor [Methylogaea oryzae]BBL70872.1 TonB-dependent receptor [Methylogaea oryzae]
MKKTLCGLVCSSALLPLQALAEDTTYDITERVLQEELSWLQAEATVFSASRHEEKVSRTAAAVFVLSGEDIKRSGATSIPDALRLVPGLDVAQINSNVWAISSRGFNDRTANKMLVLMDGRTLYHPAFSGTLWRTKDTLLEDVERIEVIRGPGAAMWGSNAVNGVINIITKKAKDSQGVYATAGVGTEENGFSAVRYGGQLGEHTYYKGYVKYFSRDTFALSGNGKNANDAWENTQGGFKLEGDPTQQDSLTLQGDVYQGNANSLQYLFAPLAPYKFYSGIPERYSGGNVQGRWDHRFTDASDMTLKLYFDHTEDATRFSAINDLADTRVDTYDADWQHRLKWDDTHAWTWGLGYRYIHERTVTDAGYYYSMRKPTRDLQWISLFLQDEITLAPDRWKVIFGTRVEHNDYTGFEVQPNGRLVFTPSSDQTVWASISRAVRVPSRAYHDMRSTYMGQVSSDVFLIAQGNPSLKSEALIAYELGYRIQPTDKTSLDIATFYNEYQRLYGIGFGSRYTDANLTPFYGLPVTWENNMRGNTYGAEVMGQWKVTDAWRLQANYTYLQIQLSGNNLNQQVTENSSPHHQFSLWSSHNLAKDLSADAILRYVDEVPGRNIGSYVTMDLRFSWQASKNIELAVVGRNLLDGRHPEFSDSALTTPLAQIQRSVYGQINLRY